MADSDCSNCDNDACPVRDYSYDCYKAKSDNLRVNLTKEDINSFKQQAARFSELYKKLDDDSFYQVSYFLQQIVDCYNLE